jgi:hypothetical protein
MQTAVDAASRSGPESVVNCLRGIGKKSGQLEANAFYLWTAYYLFQEGTSGGNQFTTAAMRLLGLNSITPLPGPPSQ